MVIQKVLNDNVNSDFYLIIAKMEEEFKIINNINK
jgi:hypothetical protein